ncbi:MAG: adenylyl-sulfate kinase [Microbacteriaceae bacterium]
MTDILVEGADLDALELALGGAIVPRLLGAAEGDTLHDGERTPLAVVTAAGLVPERPLARVAGPLGDPALRRAPAAVRAALDGRERAVLVDDLPSRADAALLAGLGGPLVLVVAAGRAAAGATALLRATRGLLAADAAGPDAAGPDAAVSDAVVLAVPISPGAPDGVLAQPSLEEALAGYGLRGLSRLTELRPASAVAPLATLAAEWRERVDAVYPPASAAELAGIGLRDTGRRRGAAVLFSGLSGSGKSTVANAVAAALRERGDTPVVLLDGDEVRQLLSRGLGFDAASRALNVQRIGYVASIVAGCGGIALAAPIAPFADGRRELRERVEAQGIFVLVHVATPLAVCEARDRKGLYRAARRGEVAEFTGISSPYETPDDADLVIDTSVEPLETSVERVLAALEARGIA